MPCKFANNALKVSFTTTAVGNGAHFQRLPFFGTRVGGNKESNGTATTAGFVKIDTANVSYTAVDASVSNNWILDINEHWLFKAPLLLWDCILVKLQLYLLVKLLGMDFATPIHTSHHTTRLLKHHT